MIVSPKNKTIINFRKDLILDLIDKGYEVIITGPNKDYIDDITSMNVRFYEIPLKKDSISPLNDIHYLLSLRKILGSEKPDILFSYTVKPIIYSGIASKFKKLDFFPLVTGLGRSFDSNANQSVLKIIKKLYKISLSSAKQVIFQNYDDEKLFIEEGIVDKKKSHVVLGSGVNMNRFKPIAFPNRIEFLMISRLLFEKGFTFYLDSAHILKKKYPDISFNLVGALDDSISENVKEKLQSYCRSGDINYLGEINDPATIIGNTSVFVLPTFYREGLPRTILEAMACGKPIITTDWVGAKETVSNGENGFLIPIQNTSELIKKMEYFINNPKDINKMGNASYEICKKDFEVGVINRQIFKIWGV